MRKHDYPLLFVSWCFFFLGLTACSGVFSATPASTATPTRDTATSTPAPLQGALPTATCDEAVQQILHHEIDVVKIYRQKVPIAYIPNSANSVVAIIMYPRSARTDNPTEPYNPFLEVSISPLDYPDRVCYPRLVDAVKQINAHLAKDQQVQLDMLFTVG